MELLLLPSSLSCEGGLSARSSPLQAHAENLHVQSYHPSQTRMHVKVQSLNTHAKSLEAQASLIPHHGPLLLHTPAEAGLPCASLHCQA